MSFDLFVAPVLPQRFNPDKDCATCKYPLPIDQVVSTVCGHIFHAQCLIAQCNYAAKTTASARELAAGVKSKFEEPDVLCPCPTCRGELNGTRFTPLPSLPANINKEDRDCSICLTLQDPSVVKTPCHQFHSLCFDQATELAATAKKLPVCPEDASELLIQDLYDGAQVRQNLYLPALPSKPYVYHAGMDVPGTNVNRVDSFNPNVLPPMNDDDISNIVLGIIAVVLLASVVSYAVNAIFFAGANPILYVLGLPVGLILDPIIRGFIVG